MKMKVNGAKRFTLLALAAVLCFFNVNFAFAGQTYKEVIPLKYDEACGFSEGLAAVGLISEDGHKFKFGYIDKTGKVVIPFKYDYFGEENYKSGYYFSEGLSAVKLNSKWGFIDKTGKEVIPPKYDLAGDFSEGLAAVGLIGEDGYKFKFGYIDKTGK